MKYEIIESVTMFTGETQQFVSLEKEDGSIEVFLVDPENPRYQAFLEETTK